MSEFKEIKDNLIALDAPSDGVPLSLYLSQGKETVLIDSSLSSTPDSHLLAALEKAKVSPNLLINTHGHVDHFGGNAKVKTTFPNMKIAIHSKEAAWAEDHKRHYHEMYMCMPDDWQFEDGGKFFLELCGDNSAIDIHLEQGDRLEFSPYSFQVLHSTGHSPGHITLFDENHKLAICGDLALGWGPNVSEGAEDQPSVYYSPSEYLEGVEMARSLDAELYCTSHFGVLNKEAMHALCDKSHDFVSSFDRWSLEALSANEPKTLHQIVTAVASNIPSYEFAYHIHASTQAHLMQHVAKGRVRSLMIDNRKHYLKLELRA